MKNFSGIMLVWLLTTVTPACKTGTAAKSGDPTPGLYEVAILYPHNEQARFDMNYYETKHMPMVAGMLGANLVSYRIVQGISGRTPNDKPTYVVIGYFYVKDVGQYGQAIAANREAIVGDFANYTNVQPVVQIGEVRQDGMKNRK